MRKKTGRCIIGLQWPVFSCYVLYNAIPIQALPFLGLAEKIGACQKCLWFDQRQFQPPRGANCALKAVFAGQIGSGLCPQFIGLAINIDASLHPVFHFWRGALDKGIRHSFLFRMHEPGSSNHFCFFVSAHTESIACVHNYNSTILQGTTHIYCCNGCSISAGMV